MIEENRKNAKDETKRGVRRIYSIVEFDSQAHEFFENDHLRYLSTDELKEEINAYGNLAVYEVDEMSKEEEMEQSEWLDGIYGIFKHIHGRVFSVNLQAIEMYFENLRHELIDKLQKENTLLDSDDVSRLMFKFDRENGILFFYNVESYNSFDDMLRELYSEQIEKIVITGVYKY